jgi:protein-tyrosine phosphatase
VGPLASAENFRDVAGNGYPTRHGTRVRRGVFFLAGELDQVAADGGALTGLPIGERAITDLHDLRTAEESAAHPDPALPGVARHHWPVPGVPPEAVAGLEEPGEAEALMRDVYRGFVEDRGARAGFGGLLRALGDGTGPALVHCTTGKDRAGWAAALLLHVAGVADEVVVEDYLVNNERAESTRARYLTMVEAALGPHRVDAYQRLLVADAGYLRTAYDAARAAYGSLDGYLERGLGLDEAASARLRARML